MEFIKHYLCFLALILLGWVFALLIVGPIVIGTMWVLEALLA